MAVVNLGFLASHRGSGMQAVVEACRSGVLDAQPAAVISNNAGSLALAKARTQGIPGFHLSSRTHPDPGDLDAAIAQALKSRGVNLVLLSGYMKMVGPRTLAAFPSRILNIHPALLPRFGGAGMYGMRVHEAVIQARETVTGVTVHLVDQQYDRGPVVTRTRVPVLPGDDPASLAERVAGHEHRLYVDTVRRIISGEINLDTLR